MNASLKEKPSRPTLNFHLRVESKAPDALRHVILDIARAATYISYAIKTTEMGLAGTKNEFGEQQVKLDVLSDEIISTYLMESDLVKSFISEERSEQIELSGKGKYSVVFDPLDGSSLVDANFAIGSIFGIYEGAEIIGKKPRDQVAALYVLYGPRTLLVYSTGKGVHECILNDVGEFVLLRSHLGIGDDAKNYSPGNLKSIHENAGYKKAFDTWVNDSLTLRYSGCMVADIHHILSKGQGVFTNIGEKAGTGKLRHVFECGPFAYLVEQAGGSASDGKMSLLDKEITAIDQRTGIVIGSKNEVARVNKLLA